MLDLVYQPLMPMSTERMGGLHAVHNITQEDPGAVRFLDEVRGQVERTADRNAQRDVVSDKYIDRTAGNESLGLLGCGLLIGPPVLSFFAPVLVDGKGSSEATDPQPLNSGAAALAQDPDIAAPRDETVTFNLELVYVGQIVMIPGRDNEGGSAFHQFPVQPLLQAAPLLAGPIQAQSPMWIIAFTPSRAADRIARMPHP